MHLSHKPRAEPRGGRAGFSFFTCQLRRHLQPRDSHIWGKGPNGHSQARHRTRLSPSCTPGASPCHHLPCQRQQRQSFAKWNSRAIQNVVHRSHLGQQPGRDDCFVRSQESAGVFSKQRHWPLPRWIREDRTGATSARGLMQPMTSVGPTPIRALGHASLKHRACSIAGGWTFRIAHPAPLPFLAKAMTLGPATTTSGFCLLSQATDPAKEPPCEFSRNLSPSLLGSACLLHFPYIPPRTRAAGHRRRRTIRPACMLPDPLHHLPRMAAPSSACRRHSPSQARSQM
jgi:hypothetical protein